MEFLSRALSVLPEVAKSPLGAMLFVVVIGAWLAVTWKVKRNKNLLQRIESFPAAERPRVFEMETGRPYLARGLTGEQWLRAKSQDYKFYAFVVSLAAVVLLFWMLVSTSRRIPVPGPDIRVEGPKLIDLRSQMDPNATSAADARQSEAFLTILRVSYESKDESSRKARVLEQEATLKLGERIFVYRWFQFADMSQTGKGWLGATGDVAPFVVEPGKIPARSTQFKPRSVVTWEEMLAAVKKAQDGELVLSTRVGGVSNAGDVLIKTSCIPDLAKAHNDVASVEKSMGRPPIYLQILCKSLSG